MTTSLLSPPEKRHALDAALISNGSSAEAARSGKQMVTHASAPIMYVEDREEDMFFMRRACTLAGISRSLQLISSGAQAIQYLGGAAGYSDRKRFPLPCLVILDLNLPEISGFEILMWIRSKSELCALPVVAFTAFGSAKDVRRCTDLGAMGYLVKPATVKELVEMVIGLKRFWETVAQLGQ